MCTPEVRMVDVCSRACVYTHANVLGDLDLAGSCYTTRLGALYIESFTLLCLDWRWTRHMTHSTCMLFLSTCADNPFDTLKQSTTHPTTLGVEALQFQSSACCGLAASALVCMHCESPSCLWHLCKGGRFLDLLMQLACRESLCWEKP